MSPKTGHFVGRLRCLNLLILMIDTHRKKIKDTLFDGGLICKQHAHGYRFSLDALLVAWFCRLAPSSRVLDIGCGSGVIGLILACRHKAVNITGIEVQDTLAAVAMSNVRANDLQERMNIIHADVRSFRNLLEPESFDQVVCNPPYGRLGAGRVNIHDESAIARHELHGNLADILEAACFAVKNRCPVTLIYPARRFNYLTSCLLKQKLILRRLLPVYSYPQAKEAKLILIEAVKNGGEGCKLHSPFFLYRQKGGSYTREMEMVYNLYERWQLDRPMPQRSLGTVHDGWSIISSHAVAGYKQKDGF